ncbi:hypothetical protein F7Q99_33045 [Streptomyces kaniharaensis]|uniref:Uncharacterized protein n=1 Tax=Streptomyces kaniharaensis TaxID=212423 RepID=A0A6N7L2D9_9ACTN|nr:hypothetical protein [Streptomyces kaniharaensis]MQS16887.1 hypothetical protein [Streptomyces kaniharaensis]
MAVVRGGSGSRGGWPVRRWAAVGIGASAGFGLLSLLLYATQCGEPLAVLGSGLAVAAAAAVGGGSVGFLFGIPRAVAAEGHDAAGTQGALGGAAPAARPTYTANTNLEQVSDWLTKLLIGAGLTQLGAVGDAARSMLDALAPSLGGRPDSRTFAAALVLDFLVLGFLTGWLLTRLLLASALSHADRQALESFVTAQNLSDTGDVEGADRYRARAMEALGLPVAEAERYDGIRRTQPSGPPRTATMQALVDAARQSAASTGLTADQVADFFAAGGEGQRIYALALMQGDPSLVTWTCVFDAIEHSRSAFEQFQALVAARTAVHRLPAVEHAMLRRTLEAQLHGGWISRSVQRRHMTEDILAALAHPAGARPAAEPI